MLGPVTASLAGLLCLFGADGQQVELVVYAAAIPLEDLERFPLPAGICMMGVGVRLVVRCCGVCAGVVVLVGGSCGETFFLFLTFVIPSAAFSRSTLAEAGVIPAAGEAGLSGGGDCWRGAGL